MLEVVIVDILPIGFFFLNRAWMLHFIGPAKPTINNSKLRIVIWIPHQKIDLIELHYTSRSRFLMIQSIFFGVKERIPRSGEKTGKSHITQYI